MIVWAILAVAFGGILKGATGAGVPIVAAPAITMLYDVQTAVAVLVITNLFSNIWQAWAHRRDALPPRFLAWFAGAGMVGVVAGTLLLVWLPAEALALLVALAVLGYLALRLLRAGFTLAREVADRIAGPVGFLGGLLQGSTGLSAPAVLTFLNAMRLPRTAFIGTISVFFVTMSAMQVPTLIAVGVLTPERIALGFGVLAIATVTMPLGAWLGRHLSPRLFDALMLALLAAIAVKILIESALSLAGGG